MLGSFLTSMSTSASRAQEVGNVVQFLQNNGTRVTYSGLDTNNPSWGTVSANMSVGLIPELMEIEGVGYTVEDTSLHPGPDGFYLHRAFHCG